MKNKQKWFSRCRCIIGLYFLAVHIPAEAAVLINWNSNLLEILTNISPNVSAPSTWVAQLIRSPSGVPSAIDTNAPFVPTGGETVLASQELNSFALAGRIIGNLSPFSFSDSIAGGFVYTRVFNVDFNGGSPSTPTLYGQSTNVTGPLVISVTATTHAPFQVVVTNCLTGCPTPPPPPPETNPPVRASFELINFQGRLVDSGGLVNGLKTMEFRLYTSNTVGALLWQETQEVTVVDGLYAVQLGATGPTNGSFAAAFTNTATFLEVAVNGQTLSPRERMVAVAYAVRASAVSPGAITTAMLADGAVDAAKILNNSITTAKLNPSAVTSESIINGGISNADLAVNSVNAANIVDGSLVAADLNTASFSNTFWKTDGNAGTVAGTHFLGTTANRPVEIRANGIRAALITPSNGAPNVVLGAAQNALSNGTAGSSILGGSNNTIAAQSSFSVIAGGDANGIGSNAPNATIPGGLNNNVGSGATNAFAAGRQAQANHRGVFVWADDQALDFASTAENQFLIRASGGMFVNAGTVGDAKISLVADSDNNDESDNPELFFEQDGGGANSFIAMEGEANTRATNTLANALLIGSEDNNPAVQFLTDDAVRMTILTGGNVGIGTSTPTNKLHVAGTVQATAYITGSDRNSKENIQAVSVDEVLAKVASLPMATWKFKDDASGTHIGPMAQDFRAAFNLGNTDTGIFTVDADGVALAAIQALAKERSEDRSQISEVSEEVSGVSVRVSELEEENARLREELEAIKRKIGM